jgi:hypothetical protein
LFFFSTLPLTPFAEASAGLVILLVRRSLGVGGSEGRTLGRFGYRVNQFGFSPTTTTEAKIRCLTPRNGIAARAKKSLRLLVVSLSSCCLRAVCSLSPDCILPVVCLYRRCRATCAARHEMAHGHDMLGRRRRRRRLCPGRDRSDACIPCPLLTVRGACATHGAGGNISTVLSPVRPK